MAKYPLALLPSVTISDGRAQLAPKPYEASSQSGTPAQAITSWVNQGAAWVHVVDSDAIAGKPANHGHITPGRAHLQYAAGVRDEATLTAALATGASRVLVEAGDASVIEWASSAFHIHGDRLAASLDIRDPDVFDTALALEHAGCHRFVVSDHVHENHWRHGDRHLLADFCATVKRPVMASGGISHLGDLHALHELVPQGLDGIIIGPALYSGAFTYTEAMAAGADRFDMFFWGPPE